MNTHHRAGRWTPLLLVMSVLLAVAACSASGGPLPADVQPVPSPRAGCPEKVDVTSSVPELPELASLRWCDGPSLMETVTPPDLLTRGVDQWRVAFNDLPKPARQMSCNAMGGPTYVFIATGTDGSRHTLVADLGGCSTIAGKVGATKLVDLAKTLVLEQRRAGVRPPQQSVEACHHLMSVLPAETDEITEASWCVRSLGGTRVTGRPVSASVVKVVVADLAAHTVRSTRAIYGEGPTLQLTTPSGEFRSIQYVAIPGRFVWSDGTEQYEWRPSPATMRALRSSLPGEFLEGDECTQSFAEPLAKGAAMPDGTARVWFCSSSRVAPGEALVTDLGTLIRASESPTGCVADDEYFVGVTRAGVWWRGALATGCAAPSSVVATYVTLVQQQRQANPPAAREPEGKWCSWEAQLPSLIPVDVRQTTATRFCAATRPDGSSDDGLDLGVPLRPAEHRVVQADLTTLSVASQAPAAEGTSLLATLVMPSLEGVPIRTTNDGTELRWYDAVTGRWMSWTPRPEVTAIFQKYRVVPR